MLTHLIGINITNNVNLIPLYRSCPVFINATIYIFIMVYIRSIFQNSHSKNQVHVLQKLQTADLQRYQNHHVLSADGICNIIFWNCTFCLPTAYSVVRNSSSTRTVFKSELRFYFARLGQCGWPTKNIYIYIIIYILLHLLNVKNVKKRISNRGKKVQSLIDFYQVLNTMVYDF